MSLPQLPPIPQVMPRTQAEWDQVVAALRDWQRVLQPILQLMDTPATSATAGSASALPATPSAYLVTTINGTTYKLPGYNP